MRILVALLVSVMLVTVVVAEDFKVKDMSDDHWAAWAVNDLIKMGVTKGYPDGTFRGTKQITRYETAVFLAKLAKAIGASDIQADLAALKSEVASLKVSSGTGGLSGSYALDWQFANLLATSGTGRGGVASYRLKLNSTQKVGDADVVINLDTMDAGFYSSSSGGNANIIPNLIDVESKLVVDLADLGLDKKVDLTLTAGPGSQQHTDMTNVLPGETGRVYTRPDTGVMANTTAWGTAFRGGYLVKDIDASGRIVASEMTGGAGWNFADLPLVNTLALDVDGSWISKGMYSSTDRDLRASIGLAMPLADKVDAAGTIGLAGSSTDSMMLAGEVALNDVWETGTVATIKVAKVGGGYLNTGADLADAEFDLAGLDTFDRALINGVVNLGGKVEQTISEELKVIGRGDLRLSGDYKYRNAQGRLSAEGGISYAVAPNTNLGAVYRIDQSKDTNDTTDVAAVGLVYNF
ncbi:MAG: S-layer homology domain-containing protein [bacterium]